MQDVLLLNADYVPVQILAWERAVCLLMSQRVRSVASYTDRVIRSTSFEMEWPAVVSLVEYLRVRASPRLSRRNVMARDDFACQYCGLHPVTREGHPALFDLTIDHVIPRAQARDGKVFIPARQRLLPVSCWENLTTACAPCNQRKADRTPKQAKMVLRSRPRRPSVGDSVRIALARTAVPAEWAEFL